MANRDLTNAEKDALESMIDSANLQSVIMGLSEICGLKSEHILTMYNDKVTAKAWATAEGVLGVTVCDKRIACLSF